MALTIGAIHSSKGIPKSVAQITKDASEYEFNALVPLKYWLRTAAALNKQAQVYMKEGDDEMTYFLLFRQIHLFVSHLPTHPQYKKEDPAIKALREEVNKHFEALEFLKAGINRRYDEYMKIAGTRQARRQEETTNRIALREPEDTDSFASSSTHVKLLRGQEHADLAATLAGQEFSRRASGRQGLPPWQIERADLAARMQAIRNRVEPRETESTPELEKQRQAYIANRTGYGYPTVPVRRTLNVQSQPPEPKPSSSSPFTQQAPPPTLPPKAPHPERASTLPPRPGKVAASAVPSKVPSEPAYTFAPGAHLENGTPLRTIFLPPTMRTTFLRLAHQNTLTNLETCGFLAGTLRANALFASTLIIPKQTATSDTCEMTDESELFDFVDQHELMVLGWIHTHPTQTCFMSSRDLHTHSGYQMMLAESIAIVCAPSKGDTSHGGDWGVYRLTDPPGKMAILQCDKPGIFHPHEVDNIYTDAMRPGHVMEISGMDFEIVDLR